MSTDGHDQMHQNGYGEDVGTLTESHARPHEASTLTATNIDTPEHVPPHPEDHASDNGAVNNASISPAMQLIPQAEPPHAESGPELYHDDIENPMERGCHSENEGADEEEDDDEEEEEGDDDDDEGEEDENEEEDEEEDEDEDEEPALKYERFGGGAYLDLLKKDSASALAVSNKFLVTYTLLIQRDSVNIAMQALGTHNGFAHILDLTGKRTKTFKPHTASVVDMCFDTTAEFVATASMDGEHLSPGSLSPPNDLN